MEIISPVNTVEIVFLVGRNMFLPSTVLTSSGTPYFNVDILYFSRMKVHQIFLHEVLIFQVEEVESIIVRQAKVNSVQ